MMDTGIDADNNCGDMDEDEDLSRHHQVSLTLQNMDWDDLTNIINHLDVAPMDQATQQMMSQTKQILLSLRHQLKTNNIILRIPYKGDSYQMFKVNYFQQISSIYMNQMNIYSLVQKLTGRHPEIMTQQCLSVIVNRVETTLDDLYQSKCLNNVQHTKLKSNCSETQLNYLYFVPDQNEVALLLRPIVVCHNGPTVPVADYLSELLWNIFDRVTHCQKFSQGADIIHAIEVYAQQNLLRSTTFFVTFTMDDLSTVFPHQQILKALKHFLQTYAVANEDFQHEGMTIETILRLTKLVLNNQYFVYNNELYRQTAGGASGSSLSIPLAYIYLSYWNQSFITSLIDNKQELFGRHLEEGFLTWNGSENDLYTLFQITIPNHTQICRLPVTFGPSVHFHDAYISHRNGILHSKVYHYPSNNQNTLLYFPSLSLDFNSKSVRKELIRAACCCSNVKDFIVELNRIEVACFSRGLPSLSVEQYTQEFFLEFHNSSICLFLTDQNDYQGFRLRVIEYQQQQTILKKQRKLDQKNTFIFHYTDGLNVTDVITLKQALDTIIKERSKYYSEWKQMKLKLQPRRFVPLSFDDYLIHNRPPLRLLNLSKIDIDEDNDDMSD